MYRYPKPNKTSLKGKKTYEAERIEEKVQRIMSNKEPITDTAPKIYNERGEFPPSQNPRTDRWEIAVEAMDKVTAAHYAKRENAANFGKELDKQNKDLNPGQTDGKIDGTGTNTATPAQ